MISSQTIRHTRVPAIEMHVRILRHPRNIAIMDTRRSISGIYPDMLNRGEGLVLSNGSGESHTLPSSHTGGRSVHKAFLLRKKKGVVQHRLYILYNPAAYVANATETK